MGGYWYNKILNEIGKTYSMVPTGPENLEKSWNFKNAVFGPGKVQEFSKVRQKVLENGHRSLNIGPTGKFNNKFETLLLYKCQKDREYCKNMPKWSWKMTLWSWKGPGKVLEFCDGDCVGTMIQNDGDKKANQYW